jgi:hypothetical protein
MKCPKCGGHCDRDSVDIGVGIMHGPYGCEECGWSESPEYDLSDGRSPLDEKGGAIDQYGGYHHPGSARALGVRLAENPDEPIPFKKSEGDV